MYLIQNFCWNSVNALSYKLAKKTYDSIKKYDIDIYYIAANIDLNRLSKNKLL